MPSLCYGAFDVVKVNIYTIKLRNISHNLWQTNGKCKYIHAVHTMVATAWYHYAHHQNLWKCSHPSFPTEWGAFATISNTIPNNVKPMSLTYQTNCNKFRNLQFKLEYIGWNRVLYTGTACCSIRVQCALSALCVNSISNASVNIPFLFQLSLIEFELFIFPLLIFRFHLNFMRYDWLNITFGWVYKQFRWSYKKWTTFYI